MGVFGDLVSVVACSLVTSLKEESKLMDVMLFICGVPITRFF